MQDQPRATQLLAASRAQSAAVVAGRGGSSAYDIDVSLTLSYKNTMQVFRLKPYLRAMKRMGFDEAGMAEIERSICAAPDSHPMISGLRGVRKARFARAGRGKSGGGRLIYFAMIGRGRIYMMSAYPKSRQEDLSGDDRKAILRVIGQLFGGDTS